MNKLLNLFMEKLTKIGAITGAIWGIFPYVLAVFEDVIDFRIWPFFEQGIMKPVGFLLILPTRISILLGFRFYSIIIGALLIGILIGVTAGYLYSLFKMKKGGEIWK